MAWYDDPSLVNPDTLPLDETGLTPALPAAPVAPTSPFAEIRNRLAAENQAAKQPRGLQALSGSGPSYSAEEWAAMNQPTAIAANADAGVLSDTGNLLKRGYAGTAQGLNWLASVTPGLKDVPKDVIDWQGNADYWKQVADEAGQALSPEQKAASEKKFFNDDYTPGPAWGDVRSYTGGAIESLPGTVAGMAAGGPITKGLMSLGGAVLPRLGIGLATEAGTGLAGAAASKAIPKLTEKAAERLTMGAGAIGYGAGEGVTAAASDGAQAYDLVRGWDREKLKASSPLFKELVAKGLTDDQAHEEVAKTAAKQVATRAGLTVGVLGAPMGAVFGKWFHGAGGKALEKSALGSIGIGAGGEAAQEFPQSGAEQFYQNQAIQQHVDPTQRLDSDVLNAAVSGALSGALMGGVMGGAGHYSEGASAKSEIKQRMEAVKANLPNVPDDLLSQELQRVTSSDLPKRAMKAAQDYRALLETEQVERAGDKYLLEAAKTVATEVAKPNLEDQDTGKILSALDDWRAEQTLNRIAGDLSAYTGDPAELLTYADERAKFLTRMASAAEMTVNGQSDKPERIASAQAATQLADQLRQSVLAQEQAKAAAPPQGSGQPSGLPPAPTGPEAGSPPGSPAPILPPAPPVVSAPGASTNLFDQLQPNEGTHLPDYRNAIEKMTSGRVAFGGTGWKANWDLLEAWSKDGAKPSQLGIPRTQEAATEPTVTPPVADSALPPAPIPTPTAEPTPSPTGSIQMKQGQDIILSPPDPNAPTIRNPALAGDQQAIQDFPNRPRPPSETPTPVPAVPRPAPPQVILSNPLTGEQTPLNTGADHVNPILDDMRALAEDLARKTQATPPATEAPAAPPVEVSAPAAEVLPTTPSPAPDAAVTAPASQPQPEGIPDEKGKAEAEADAEALLSNRTIPPAQTEAGIPTSIQETPTNVAPPQENAPEVAQSPSSDSGRTGSVAGGLEAGTPESITADSPAAARIEARKQYGPKWPERYEVVKDGKKFTIREQVPQNQAGDTGANPDFAPLTTDARQLKSRAQALADPEFRAAMEGYVRTAGWAERGGHLILKNPDEPVSKDNIAGRTKWLPHSPWWAASTGARKGFSEVEIKALLQKFQRGEAPKNAKEARFLDFLMEDLANEKARADEAAELERELTPAELERLDRAEQEARAWLGDDRYETMLESLAKRYPDAGPAQFNRSLLLTLEDTLEQRKPDIQPDAASGTGRNGAGSPQAVSESAGAPTDEKPILESYSNAKIKARQDAIDKAKANQDAKDKAADAKIAADKSANDFKLTGSDSAADIAAANGQEDLLASRPQAPVLKSVPTKAEDWARKAALDSLKRTKTASNEQLVHIAGELRADIQTAQERLDPKSGPVPAGNWRKQLELNVKEFQRALRLVEGREGFNNKRAQKLNTSEPAASADNSAVRDAFVQRFANDHGFKNIVEARAFITGMTGLRIVSGTLEAKQADELIEQAVVKRARQIVKEATGTDDAYRQLVRLYELQPSLNVRTSSSITDQAYSTPVPLAFLASHIAGIGLNPKAVVVEPTAGNGALLIAANPDQVFANELNPDRAKWLQEQGFKTTIQDATRWNPGKKADIIIANPPFGGVTNKETGNKEKWNVPSGAAPKGNYETGEVDHAIVLQQLKNMKDDGDAVLLVGGVDAANNDQKQNKYNAKAKRDFYLTLYNDYQVVDHFTVAGSLYAKQGASYPVDVIVIRGRGKSTLTVPAANLPRVYSSWDKLGEAFFNDRLVAWQPNQQRSASESPAADERNVSGRTEQPDSTTDQPDTDNRGTGTAGTDPELSGTVQPGTPFSEPTVPGSGDSGSAGRSGVSDNTNNPTAEADSRPGSRENSERGPAGTGDGTTGDVAVSRNPIGEQPGLVSLDDLNAMFGTKGKLSSGLTFDEDSYAKAKPLFQSAMAHFGAVGKDIKEVMRLLIRSLMDRFNDPAMIKGMQPYIVRFIDDFQKEQVAAQAATQNVNQEVASDGQVQYEPASTAKAIGTLTPVNMQTAVKSALAELQKRVGTVDTYVAMELGYPQADVDKYFSAEQIDAIALALDNISSGKGFIVGDQTGVGKGRVNAAIIRWAIKNNRTPIFVTEKPNLYRDMIRDLSDIGMGTGNTKEEKLQSVIDQIFMTNSGESIPLDDEAMDWYDQAEKAKENKDKPPKKFGKFLKTASTAKQQQELARAAQNGTLPDSKQVIFTTYSQMQTVKGNRTIRHDFLDSFASNGTLILDESHNAGGGAQAQPGRMTRASYVRNLVDTAQGVFYSSATFAKRPDVMDLYSKTDMRLAVPNIGILGDTISAGGVPLQQIVSSMLAESGQYLRRERSFEGVEYATPAVIVDKAAAESVSTAMRQILAFSNSIKDDIKDISNQLAASGKAMSTDGSTGGAGAESTQFASVMHNLIAQFLLGLKAQAAADQALAAIQRGEKPVITVANTMESVINEYAREHGIGIGDPIDMTFGDLLERYLEKSRIVRETRPFQREADPGRRLRDDELSPQTLRLFDTALATIRAGDWSKIPASPIDLIKGELQKAGYKVGEITGREGIIDYQGGGNLPTYRMRGDNERGIAGRIRSIQQFNNGDVDALVLNRAGATGLSLHSSPSAGRDLRRRHMIIAQAEANIDTHMQMLGRVHRTGQVIAPRYSQLIGDIPAETRPAAVLAKKMASLNANTTSARESAVTAKDALDIMNVYGDAAVAAVMFANQDLHAQLGSPLEVNNAGDGFEHTDAARKVTGRIPLLTLKNQANLYQAIAAEYQGILEIQIALGENKLEAMTLETDAIEQSSEIVADGVPGNTSPFATSARAVTYDIRRQGRSMTIDEVQAEIAKFVGVDEIDRPAQIRNKMTDLLRATAKERTDYINQEASRLSETELESLERRTAEMYDRIDGFARHAVPGTPLTVRTPDGTILSGIVVGLERRGSPKNPVVNSAWRLKIAVADGMRTLNLPLTRLEFNTDVAANGRIAIEQADYTEVREAFDLQNGMSRENRVIIEGNLLAAYSQFGRGQIVYFRHHNGELRQGILMPRGFDVAAALREKAAMLQTAADAEQFLANQSQSLYLSAQTGTVILQYNNRLGLFTLRTPAARATGGRWFLNDALRAQTLHGDFVKVGNQMEAQIPARQLRGALDVIYGQLGESFRGVDGTRVPAPAAVQPSIATTTAPGITRESFVASVKRAFPHLSESLDKVLARGEQGQAGGTVLVDSNTLADIAQVYAAKTGRTQDQALRELNGGKLEARRDAKGNLQGFHDPRSGLTFAILPNLSEASAPAVLLHESAHSQQRADITQRGFTLVSNREMVVGPMRAFLDRVYGRLEKAGAVDDRNEYPSYIIEQAVLEGRQNGFNFADGRFLDWVDSRIGKAVGDFIRKMVNFIRATMIKRGFPININKLTVDDLVSFAQIGVQRAAEGKVIMTAPPIKTDTKNDPYDRRQLVNQALRIIFGENGTPGLVSWMGASWNQTVLASRTGKEVPPGTSNAANGNGLVSPGHYLPLVRREVGAVHVNTFRTGVRRVTTPQQAASVVLPISRSAQEQVVALVTDANQKPLAVLQHTVGLIGESLIDAKTLIGAVANIPNAAQVWFAHNHPSADAIQSRADNRISLELDLLLRGTGIKNNGMIVVAANQDASWVDLDTMDESLFNKVASTGKSPVKVLERQFVLFEEGSSIAEQADRDAFLKQFTSSGVVLMDDAGTPLAWVPMQNDEMATLKSGNRESGSARLMRIIERTNAEAALIKVDSIQASEPAIKNMMRFFNAINIQSVPAQDENGNAFDPSNIGKEKIFMSRAGDETGLQFSIAAPVNPSEATPEDARRISEQLDAAGAWDMSAERQTSRINKLREGMADQWDKGRSAWTKLLTRQQLVELIQHVPGIGALAQAFEKTARNLDAAKQELKQKVYPTAEKWRNGIVKARDHGYLLSRIIHAATLHQVDPLGAPPLQITRNTPEERAQVAEQTRWWNLTKEWMETLKKQNPELAEVYQEARANHEMMRTEQYEAMMGRIGRSGTGILREMFNRATKPQIEEDVEPLVAQLHALHSADLKEFNRIRGAMIGAIPGLKPKSQMPFPAATPLATIRQGLTETGRQVFDTLLADVQQNNSIFDQRTRFYGVLAKAARLAKEQKNPETRAFGKRLAALYQSDPMAFKALQSATLGYLSDPEALLRIEQVPSRRDPARKTRQLVMTDLANDDQVAAVRDALPTDPARRLFTEALTSTQKRLSHDANVLRRFYETQELSGPYAPLSRFGEYQVFAEKDGEKLPIYATFEQASEQTRAVKALQAEGWTVHTGYEIKSAVQQSGANSSLVGALFSLIDDSVSNPTEQTLLKDDVYQLYLHSLPDMSAAKHFIHRKGIPGFSQDALRAYAQWMNQASNAIARLRYSDILQDQLQGMTQATQQIGENPTDEAMKLQRQVAPVVNELQNSFDWLMNPSNATWANRLTGIGFFWYLTNFSTALVNLTQTPMMTFPDLAAKFNATDAAATLAATIKDYGAWKFKWGDARQRQQQALQDRFDGDMGRMLDHIERSGAVSRTETVNLAEMGVDDEFTTSKPMVALQKLRTGLAWAFQKSEVANREIAAIAAYTLARNSAKAQSMAPHEAHQYAQDMAYNVVFRTQGDFSNANRARWMRNDFTRVLTLFRSFSQMMTWRMLRDVHQAITAKGINAETGKELMAEARTRLKWMGVSSFLFGGLMGLPVYSLFMGIAGALFGNDPDDPWDVEVEVQKGLQQLGMALTGSPQSADAVRRLLMTGPMGAVAGIDLSPRTTLDLWRLWVRKAPDSKEGEDLGLYHLQQLAGPVIGGMGIAAFKSAHDIRTGLVQDDSATIKRGLEGILPAPARNILKTFRYASQGVTTRRGDKIVNDISAMDMARQAFGFTPAEIADQYDRNSAQSNLSRELSQRRKNLTNGYVFAIEAGDSESADAFMEKIGRFNELNPEVAITSNSLSQSYRQRQRAHALSEGGLYLPSRGMRARVEGEGF